MKIPIQAAPVLRYINTSSIKDNSTFGVNPSGSCFANRNCYPTPDQPIMYAANINQCCEEIYPGGSFSYGSGCSNCQNQNNSSSGNSSLNYSYSYSGNNTLSSPFNSTPSTRSSW